MILEDMLKKYGGRIYYTMIPIKDLLPTRAFIYKKIYEKYKNMQDMEEILAVKDKQSGFSYILDGHHRAKAKHDIGENTILAKILESENTDLLVEAGYWNSSKNMKNLRIVDP